MFTGRNRKNCEPGSAISYGSSIISNRLFEYLRGEVSTVLVTNFHFPRRYDTRKQSDEVDDEDEEVAVAIFEIFSRQLNVSITTDSLENVVITPTIVSLLFCNVSITLVTYKQSLYAFFPRYVNTVKSHPSFYGILPLHRNRPMHIHDSQIGIPNFLRKKSNMGKTDDDQSAISSSCWLPESVARSIFQI